MKYLTEDEEKLLLRTVREIKGKKAERDHMILFFGFNTGLRLNELLSLNVGDVRGKVKLYVRPETTKATLKRQATGDGPEAMGKKRRPVGRTLPISRRLHAAIREFIKLKLRWREGIHDDDPLFVSKKGGRLSRRSLQEVFEHWRDRAGLEGGYTVHSMRHSFGKRLIQRGFAPATVQKLLGHKSMGSTGIYIEAGFEEMQEAVEAR